MKKLIINKLFSILRVLELQQAPILNIGYNDEPIKVVAPAVLPAAPFILFTITSQTKFTLKKSACTITKNKKLTKKKNIYKDITPCYEVKATTTNQLTFLQFEKIKCKHNQKKVHKVRNILFIIYSNNKNQISCK